MNARIEAAAKALRFSESEVPATEEWATECGRLAYLEDAKTALEAADAVMFDDYAVDRITEVLVAHQRQSPISCLCGWAKLGASHPAHQGRIVLAALRDAPHATGEAGDPSQTVPS